MCWWSRPINNFTAAVADFGWWWVCCHPWVTYKKKDQPSSTDSLH